MFALDSRMSDYLYPNDLIEYPKFYFTDHFAQNYKTCKLDDRYVNENLWSMFYSDLERFTTYGTNKEKNNEYYSKCIMNLISFFDEIIIKNDIDAVIYENVSNSFSYAAYLVSKQNNINYFGISSTRLPNRFEIQTTVAGNAEKIHNTLLKIEDNSIQVPKDIKISVSSYLNNIMNIMPDYMRDNAFDTKVNLIKRYFRNNKIDQIKSYIQYIYNESELYYAYQIGHPIKLSLSMIKREVSRKIKLKRIEKYYDLTSEKDSYFLYPLHYHPESSTSVLAANYVNEWSVIENISKNLPFGKILYIKDHMSAAGYPSIDFYKKIKKLPNVKLIHYSENTKELIKHAEAIITLTSTVGYEALLLNKKVFLFGEVFYSQHPNCQKINSYEEIFNLLQHTDIVNNTDQVNINFLYAYFLNTFDGKLSFTGTPNIELAKTIAEVVNNFNV